MDVQKKRLMTDLLVVGFVFVGLVMLNGCKKEAPPTPEDTNSAHDHEHGEEGTHEHSEMAMTTETGKEVAVIEQTTCPVMEGSPPIKKEIFTEYVFEYDTKFSSLIESLVH